MITLNGVTLNPNLIWVDRDSWVPVAQSVKRTLGGKLVVTHIPLSGGRPITLASTTEQGWLTKAQMDSIIAMAIVSGGIYTLVIDSSTFTVMFRNEEPPAVNFQPLIIRTTPQADDYFLAQIKLIEI